jgi:transcriptional regulator with XRE-family HTH domain
MRGPGLAAISVPRAAPLPGKLLANARRRAGLTQTELAKRLAITQAAVAQLERADSNPRLATLDRALRAAGFELVLSTRPRRSAVDESLIRQQLELAPADRLHGLEEMYEQARKLTTAGERHRGELA